MSQNIACVGVGNIGRAWAAIFARAGHRVALYDDAPAALDAALPAIADNLAAMEQEGLAEDAAAALARIRVCRSLAEALAGADYVQESVIEEIETKRAIFRTLDREAPPEAIIASSVSSLPPSEFMANLAGGARCIVTHPTNPPSLIPVIEVMLGPATSEETYRKTCALLEGVGQIPVRLNKEIFGYVLNRLQFALINEALHLVEGGYVSAVDLDKIVKHGLGRRWAFMGPFETNHLNATGGIQEYYDKFAGAIGGILADLKPESNALRPELIARLAEEMEATTPVADVPARQAWRDKQLTALWRHFAEVNGDAK
jgi:L-gulonate 3-dehydrogenase